MDVVVTVPKKLWSAWLEEGNLPGEEWDGAVSYFIVSSEPQIKPGERVYVVAHGKLRGYAPLVRVEHPSYRGMGIPSGMALVRHGGAQAVTILRTIQGFRGYRYRWWPRSEEIPFPDWMEP